MSNLAFSLFTLNGIEAQKFLQGQVTLNVELLAENTTRYTGICNLKGRIQYGLWLTKRANDAFEIVTTQDQAEDLAKHIKKYGAFSKMTLNTDGEIFPTIDGIYTQFSTAATDIYAWQMAAIASGQAWICAASAEKFQPQELRLHQREGVHYDKGCYLGQEVVARLWFKASPKQWLHLVQAQGDCPEIATVLSKSVEVVNSLAVNTGYIALVIARPEALEELEKTDASFEVLALPEIMNTDVSRPK